MPRDDKNSSRSIQMPISIIGAGSFLRLYSLMARNSIFILIMPANIVKNAPDGKTIEKNKIQPSYMNNSLY